MAYTKEWYDSYQKQLQEKTVRRVHDEMFEFFDHFYNNDYVPPKVIDLGCATMEYFRRGYLCNYFGIDKNYIENSSWGILGDYTKLNLKEVCPFEPDSFVSIFSTEIIMPPAVKYKFYERIFRENPSLQAGMVAGFYYKDKPHESLAFETSGNYNDTVYQTIEDQRDYRSQIFDEFRTYVDVHSEMFGDLVEVWKFFRRRPA